MTIDRKKEHILRCVKLGMDVFQAQLIAECSIKEIEKLDEDKDFQDAIELHNAISELELLEQHEAAILLQAERGTTSAIQWKLERINPKRWGKDEKKGIDFPKNLHISLGGVDPSERKD